MGKYHFACYSYPDITLLPALARLLDTDLNTLLSFQDDLTKQEVAVILNQVSETIEQSDFAAGYDLAMSRLREYPTCDQLVCNLAMLLDGALTMKASGDHRFEEYQTEIESLYRRASLSSETAIREQALSMLIAKLIRQKDYVSAQALLDSMPDPGSVDTKQIQANILIAQGKSGQAAQMVEEKLLSANNAVHTALMTLMEIAIKEKRLEDASYIADVDAQSAGLFDLWEYNSYVAHFELYSACENRTQCLKVLLPMLKSITKKWNLNQSPLYRHIKTRDSEPELGQRAQKEFIKLLCEDEDMAFVKDSPEIKEFLEKLDDQDF